MKLRRFLIALVSAFAFLLCTAFAPPDDVLGHEAGHYWGQAWSGYEQEQEEYYKVKEDFYYTTLTYAVLLGEPSATDLLNTKHLQVYTVWLMPSFHDYVYLRMVLDTKHHRGWIVFNRGDNDWYSRLFKLRAHSIRKLKTTEVTMLIPMMEEAFTQGLEEDLKRSGLDGMEVSIVRVADSNIKRIYVWSPSPQSNPAISRLLKTMLEYSNNDADFLNQYLGFSEP